MEIRRELVDDCVHCGFCLPSCPTYVLWAEEMDSPRGRIHLMGQALDGAPFATAMVGHFDACLGCMACVPACPSGVRYDQLIEATRTQVEARYRRPAGERLARAAIFALFVYPRRLRATRGPLWLYQRSGAGRLVRRLLPGRLAAMEAIAPPVRRRVRLPARVSARGRRRAVVGLVTGCVQSAFFPHVTAATARVLALEGCDVVIPRGQGCCGALPLHAGRERQARRFARRIVARFSDVDVVVTDSAGCGSAMKEFDTRVRDVSEVLAELGPVAPRHPLPLTVAYHDACHLAHAQRIRAQPRGLLAGIPGLRLREIAEPDLCCGSAGVYNLLQPGPAGELGDRKAGRILDTGADLLAAGNPGCLLQIGAALARRGASLPSAHTIEVLDASLRGRGPADLVGPDR